MLRLNRLIGDASGGSDARNPGDCFAGIAGDAGGLREGPPRIGLNDPEINSG